MSAFVAKPGRTCATCGAVGNTPHTPDCLTVTQMCKAHWNRMAEMAPPEAGIVPWDQVGYETRLMCHEAMTLALRIAQQNEYAPPTREQ